MDRWYNRTSTKARSFRKKTHTHNMSTLKLKTNAYIGILCMIPILTVIFNSVLASAQGIEKYRCPFCFFFIHREVRITNHLPYTIHLQCRTSDHSLKPQILHPSKEYSFTFSVNMFWETRYSCSFKGGGRKERTFEAFYSKYDCNNRMVNYMCKWNIGKWSAKRYSWEKNSWLSYRYQYEL